MSRRKNRTDQAFREQLQHFEAVPPDQVWHGIESALVKDKRKKQVFWISRVAASIAVLLVLGTTWFLLQKPPVSPVTTGENRETGSPEEAERAEKEENTKTMVPDTRVEEQKDRMVEPENTRQTKHLAADRKLIARKSEVRLSDVKYGESAEVGFGEQPPMEKLQTMLSRSSTWIETNASIPGTLLAVNNYPPAAIDEGEGIDVFDEWGNDKLASHDKWGVGTQVSPIYSYRNLEASGTSAPGTTYYNDVESGVVSYAGGVNVHYAPLKRLSVQSGLYYSNLGMKVGNAYYASVDNKNSFFDQSSSMQAAINNSTGIIETDQGLDYAVGANTVPQAGWELATQYSRVNSVNAPEGEILQQFQYLELPVILRYKVVDRRFGFHFLGGLSSNFLVGNSAYYQDGTDREHIGATSNIRPVNYSSVVGLGVDYSISKRFHVNLEPTFRYYLNSINTGSAIKSHPYTIGFYTGLLYTF